MIGAFLIVAPFFLYIYFQSVGTGSFLYSYLTHTFIFKERNYNSFLLQCVCFVFHYLYMCMYVSMVYLCAFTHYSSIIIISSRRRCEPARSIARITTNQIRSFFYYHFRKELNFFLRLCWIEKFMGSLLTDSNSWPSKLKKKLNYVASLQTTFIEEENYTIWSHLKAIDHSFSLMPCLCSPCFIHLKAWFSHRRKNNHHWKNEYVCTRIFGWTNKHGISNGTAIPKNILYNICFIRLTIVLSAWRAIKR